MASIAKHVVECRTLLFEILYDPSFPLAHAFTQDVRMFLNEAVMVEEVAGVAGYETSLVVKTNLPMFLSNLGIQD